MPMRRSKAAKHWFSRVGEALLDAAGSENDAKTNSWMTYPQSLRARKKGNLPFLWGVEWTRKADRLSRSKGGKGWLSAPPYCEPHPHPSVSNLFTDRHFSDYRAP